jgi:hypothetical protein
MPLPNNVQSKRGAILLEAIFATIIFIFVTLIVIDFAITSFTIHVLRYRVQREARAASLKRGNKVKDIITKSRSHLLAYFSRPFLSGRFRKLIVSLLGKDGKALKQSAILKGGDLVTLLARVTLGLNFTPIQLISRFQADDFSRLVAPGGGTFSFRVSKRFIVE